MICFRRGTIMFPVESGKLLVKTASICGLLADGAVIDHNKGGERNGGLGTFQAD